MKNTFKLKAGIYAVLAVVITAVGAKSLDDIDLKNEQTKVQNVLDQVRLKSPIMPQNSDVVTMPDVSPRVPVLPNEQGQVAPTQQLVDPFEVAARAKRMYADEIDPRMLEGTNMVVFVSFSMPDASLRRIASEVGKVGGMMVIRGFVDDSLQKTVDASQNFTNLGSQIQIHPDLFREFNVTQVPTYVLVKAGSALEGCSELNVKCQNHLKLEGDASMRAVLERMGKSENKPLAASAEAILNKLEAVQ